jgi:hypothetical protein
MLPPTNNNTCPSSINSSASTTPCRPTGRNEQTRLRIWHSESHWVTPDSDWVTPDSDWVTPDSDDEGRSDTPPPRGVLSHCKTVENRHKPFTTHRQAVKVTNLPPFTGSVVEQTKYGADGKVYGFTNTDSLHSRSARADALWKGDINAEIPLDEEKPDIDWLINEVRRGISYLIGFGAAVKAYTGTKGFGTDTLKLNNEISFVLGVLSAVPSLAFYAKSLNHVTKRAIESFTHWITTKDPSSIDSIKLSIPLLLERILPTASITGIRLQHLTDILLGIGYGSANLGMVWEAFPDELDVCDFKPILLFCIATTNLCVGIDKANKVSSDAAALIKHIVKGDDLQVETKVDLISNAIKAYRILAEKTTDTENPAASVKILLAPCQSLEGMLELLNTKIFELQLAFNNKQHTPPPNISVVSHSPGQAVTSFSSDEGTTPLMDPTQAARTNTAANQPFSCHYTFRSTQKCLDYTLGLASLLTAVAAVTSNVGGIALLLKQPPISWKSTAGRYIVGILGSSAAYGLNKKDTDKWRDALLSTICPTLQLSLNQGQQSPDGAHVTRNNTIGYIWAALGATAGCYFTQQTLADMVTTTDDSPPLHDLFEGFSYFAIASTGLLMTTTKAEPTAKLVGGWLNRLCSTSTCDKPEKHLKDEDITAYYDKQIKTLLTKIGELIEQYNDNLRRIPETSLEIAVQLEEIGQFKPGSTIDLEAPIPPRCFTAKFTITRQEYKSSDPVTEKYTLQTTDESWIDDIKQGISNIKSLPESVILEAGNKFSTQSTGRMLTSPVTYKKRYSGAETLGISPVEITKFSKVLNKELTEIANQYSDTPIDMRPQLYNHLFSIFQDLTKPYTLAYYHRPIQDQAAIHNYVNFKNIELSTVKPKNRPPSTNDIFSLSHGNNRPETPSVSTHEEYSNTNGHG